VNDDRLRRVAAIAREEAETRKNNAGYGGSHTDGGGGALEREVDAFLAGLVRRVPNGWAEYVRREDEEHRTAERARTDPDYAKFLELKARYGDQGS
jgi:hypothetical protein